MFYLKVETGSTALEKAKEGISGLLGSLTESLAGPRDEDDEKEMIIIKNSEPILLDRNQVSFNFGTFSFIYFSYIHTLTKLFVKAELYAIQTSPKTFCHEPSGPPELYEEWLMNFKVSDHQDDLSELMINRPEMRNLYSKLVCRCFFRFSSIHFEKEAWIKKV